MSLALTERQERDVEAFCDIARENGAVMSLRELLGLAGIDASERDLAAAFDSSRLGSRFLLQSGYVVERAYSGSDPRAAVATENVRRKRAQENLRIASGFGRSLVQRTVILSVSGGNSYLSAREGEDIDFFCVTRSDEMWVFMLRALLLARVHRLANREAPQLCFSCVMDERRARKEFSEKHDPIFARDALTTRVIGGTGAYNALLRSARWMADFFPAFYTLRLRETEGSGSYCEEAPRNPAILNEFLRHTLGTFLRMKSWALNRRLAKRSRNSSVFQTRVGKGYYVYESNRYRKLRGMYPGVGEKA